jgi:hypothetical protein
MTICVRQSMHMMPTRFARHLIRPYCSVLADIMSAEVLRPQHRRVGPLFRHYNSEGNEACV